MFGNFFSKNSCRLWVNLEKYVRVGQPTDDSIIRCMRFACWVTKTAKTHSEYVIFTAFAMQQCRNRLPRVMKHYSPTGRRNYGRPLKRLPDTWDWNGSTSGPTPWQIYGNVMESKNLAIIMCNIYWLCTGLWNLVCILDFECTGNLCTKYSGGGYK